MDVSPYLMQRLRTLDEFLEGKGGNAALCRQEIEKARPAGTLGGSGGKGKRPRLALVSNASDASDLSGKGTERSEAADRPGTERVPTAS